MRVTVNQIDRDFPENSTISDMLDLVSAKPPYAVAVNLKFIPKTQYAERFLEESDQVEIISPVTGG